MQALAEIASGLINPASGVANDYLNHFNEILLLIENLPVLLPEMVDELTDWSPKSYQDYFRDSPLPGSEAAAAIYVRLDGDFRRRFEAVIDDINKVALESIAIISKHRDAMGDICPEDVEMFCASASSQMRMKLAEAERLVNHGLNAPDEAPQDMADRLLDASKLYA